MAESEGDEMRHTHLVLFCIHCRAKLSTLALEDQTRDGRILCTYCRMSEAGRIVEPRGYWEGWGDILALAGMCALAWVALYFLGR